MNGFTTLVPGVNVIKHFSLLLFFWQYKLECLFPVNYFGVIFEGKARAYPSGFCTCCDSQELGEVL